MNRRDLLVGAGLAIAAVSTANADKPKTPSPIPPNLPLAATECVRIAQACLRHCLGMLASGNASMGDCAKAVADLIPAVEALAAIAPGGSRHVAPFSHVVAEIAKDCKAACEKHVAMAPCKACAESCGHLIAEIAAS